jgi:hypothetical protein
VFGSLHVALICHSFKKHARLLTPWCIACCSHDQVVVHCWAGGKRSGSVLAAWLVAQHKLSPEAAVSELKKTAESQGSTRPADAQWATQYLAGVKQ